MSPATSAPTGSRHDGPVVEVLTLADGLVVRLAGAFRAGEASLVREALLRPRPAACRDVLVDAGAVDAIDPESVAVLATAGSSVARSGGRLAFTRLSAAVTQSVDQLGLHGQLALLGAPGSRR